MTEQEAPTRELHGGSARKPRITHGRCRSKRNGGDSAGDDVHLLEALAHGLERGVGESDGVRRLERLNPRDGGRGREEVKQGSGEAPLGEERPGVLLAVLGDVQFAHEAPHDKEDIRRSLSAT
jgi:hypothetical protein